MSNVGGFGITLLTGEGNLGSAGRGCRRAMRDRDAGQGCRQGMQDGVADVIAALQRARQKSPRAQHGGDYFSVV